MYEEIVNKAAMDDRIVQLARDINGLKGELDRLQHARRLLFGTKLETEVGTESMPRERRANERRTGASVRHYILEVLKAHEDGLVWKRLVAETNEMAGQPINAKTISSSLSSMQRRGEVFHDDAGRWALRRIAGSVNG